SIILGIICLRLYAVRGSGRPGAGLRSCSQSLETRRRVRRPGDGRRCGGRAQVKYLARGKRESPARGGLSEFHDRPRWLTVRYFAPADDRYMCKCSTFRRSFDGAVAPVPAAARDEIVARLRG